MIRPLLPGALALFPAAMLLAQEPAAPQPGATVRVTWACERSPATPGGSCQVAGRLVQLRRDSITVAGASASTSVGLDAVRRLEASAGSRGHARTGALVGLALGAGLGTALLHGGGSTSLCDRSQNQDALAPSECLGLTAGAAVVGAGLGALVGAMITSERWQDVPLARVRVALHPGPARRFELAVRLAF